MQPSMNRRDFLKLLALLPGLVVPSIVRQPTSNVATDTPASGPNILVLVFDAFSAQHASLYGYQRNTTPNFVRFAEKATVYHKHQSSGVFTPPGTASLITGTHPWTHRSTALAAPTLPFYEAHNLFNALPGYHAMAYSHNMLVHLLMDQLLDDSSDLFPIYEFCLTDPTFPASIFEGDNYLSMLRERLWLGAGYFKSKPTSWLFQRITQARVKKAKQALAAQYKDEFPRGLPGVYDHQFLLEDVINWLLGNLGSVTSPYVGYFHFIPPHAPFNPRKEFIGQFDDGWTPQLKPESAFTQGHSAERLNTGRTKYDEYIAYADAEFGRLMTSMENAGLFENTCIVLTSDHGEMFERGILGHSSACVNDPAIHIPLLIHAPGQNTRQDVHTSTSAIDVLPTLLHIAGQPIPAWCEGQLLQGWGDEAESLDNSIFAFDARNLPKTGPVNQASISLTKGPLKMIHYTGYEQCPDCYELYNLDDDPEELEDLYHADDPQITRMQEELLTQLHAIGKSS